MVPVLTVLSTGAKVDLEPVACSKIKNSRHKKQEFYLKS
jgi:hypothetical protein